MTLIGAFVDLKMVQAAVTAPAGGSLTSDAIFQSITERVAQDAAKAKAINAVFVYKITQNGKVAKEWSKYLLILFL